MKLGITGHRPQKLGSGWRDYSFHTIVKRSIREQMEKLDPDILITGMALGVDQWAAINAIQMGIPFIAAIPFKCQYDKWTPQIQEKYKWILSKAAKIVLVDRTPGYISEQVMPDIYHHKKMEVRNRWIIDQLEIGDTLLAVRNSFAQGGTGHCIDQVHRKVPECRPQIIEINPDKFL